jgi:hypothetical protein
LLIENPKSLRSVATLFLLSTLRDIPQAVGTVELRGQFPGIQILAQMGQTLLKFE